MGCCCSKEALEDEESKEVRTPLLSEHREEYDPIRAAHGYQAVQESPRVGPPETGQNDSYAPPSGQDPPVPMTHTYSPPSGQDTPGPTSDSMAPGTLEKPLQGPGDDTSPKVHLEQAGLQKSAAELPRPQSLDLFYTAVTATQNLALLDPKGPTTSQESATTGALIDLSQTNQESVETAALTDASQAEQEPERKGTSADQIVGEPSRADTDDATKTSEEDEVPGSQETSCKDAAVDREDRVPEPVSGSQGRDKNTDELQVDHEELYLEHEQEYKDLQDTIRNLQVMYPDQNPDGTIYGCLKHIKSTCGDSVTLGAQSPLQVQYVEATIDHSIIPALVEVHKAAELVKELIDVGPGLSRSLSKSATESVARETALHSSEQNALSKGILEKKLEKLESMVYTIQKIHEYAMDTFKQLENALQVLRAPAQTAEQPPAAQHDDVLQQIEHREQSIEVNNRNDTLTISSHDDFLTETGDSPYSADLPKTSESESGTSDDSTEGDSSTSDDSAEANDVPESKQTDNTEQRVQYPADDDTSADASLLEPDRASPMAMQDDSFCTTEDDHVPDNTTYTKSDTFQDSGEDDALPSETSDLPQKDELPHHSDESGMEQNRHADEEFDTPRFNSTMYDQRTREDRTLDEDHTLDQTGSSHASRGLLVADDAKTGVLSMVSSMVSSTDYETAQDDSSNMTEYQDFESEDSTELNSRDETLSVYNRSQPQATDAQNAELQSPES